MGAGKGVSATGFVPLRCGLSLLMSPVLPDGMSECKESERGIPLGFAYLTVLF